MPASFDKYHRKAILDPVKFHKSRSRWNQFAATVAKIDKDLLPGPILDAGCGVGYFVLEGLRRGRSIWGVDASSGKLQRFQKLVHYTQCPEAWQQRCFLADVEELPFDSGRFAAVCSWYVLEHQRRPGVSLREMVRVIQPGGIVTVKAQDARRGYEGHCKTPWMPFLSERLARVWAETFGVAIERRADVYEVVQPQVVAILESLGCEVRSQASPPEASMPLPWQLATAEHVRRAARRLRAEMEAGRWRPPPENLYVYAVKR